MRPLLLAVAVLWSPAVVAQAPADTLTLAPGDGHLTTDWMASGTQAYTVRLVQPQAMDIGTASETTTVEGGTVTRVLTLSIPMQGMTQTDSLVADAATLMPLTHHSTGGQMEASLEFMAEGVVGMLTPRQGEATTVLLETYDPVFDSAWMGEIAQSLPLVEGAVVRVPAFTNQSPEEAIEAILTVSGQETLGERTAWAVDAQMGPLAVTYLVDPETRELLTTRFSPQPGVRVEIRPAD